MRRLTATTGLLLITAPDTGPALRQLGALHVHPAFGLAGDNLQRPLRHATISGATVITVPGLAAGRS